MTTGAAEKPVEILESRRPVSPTEPPKPLPANDNLPTHPSEKESPSAIPLDSLFKGQEKGILKLFGFTLFDPAWLGASPQNSLEDPKNDESHAGDPRWIASLIQAGEQRHQEALDIKKRIEGLEQKRKEQDDLGQWMNEWSYSGSHDPEEIKTSLENPSLMDPSKDVDHVYDPLWLPALKLAVEKKDQEALVYLNRAKKMVRDQGLQGNEGLLPLFEKAEAVKRTIEPNQKSLDDPSIDTQIMGEGRIKDLVGEAEKAYKDGNYAKALSYLKRSHNLAVDGIQKKKWWFSSDFPSIKPEENFERCMKLFMNLLDQSDALEKKVHLAWHGVSDRIGELEKQIKTETDPVKLVEMNQEIEWLKQGQAKLTEIDQIPVTSLPSSFKATAREKLTEAYLKHDEALVRQITKKEFEDLKAVGIFEDPQGGVYLKVQKEDESIEALKILKRPEPKEVKVIRGSSHETPGVIVQVPFQTESGKIEVWTFYPLGEMKGGYLVESPLGNNVSSLETVGDEASGMSLKYGEKGGTTQTVKVSGKIVKEMRIDQIQGQGPLFIFETTKIPTEKGLVTLESYYEMGPQGAIQIKNENFGEVGTLVKASQMEVRQAKLFQRTTDYFPNHSSYVGFTLDFTKDNQAAVQERISKLAGSFQESPFEVEFTKLGELTISKEFLALCHEDLQSALAVNRALSFVFSDSTLKQHLEKLLPYQNKIGLAVENHFEVPVAKDADNGAVVAKLAQMDTDFQVFEGFLDRVDQKVKIDDINKAEADSISYKGAKENTEEVLVAYAGVDQKIKNIQDLKKAKEDPNADPQAAQKQFEAVKKELKGEVQGFLGREKRQFDTEKAIYLARYAEKRDVLKTDEEWEAALSKEPTPTDPNEEAYLVDHPDAAVATPADPNPSGNPVELKSSLAVTDAGPVYFDNDWQALKNHRLNIMDYKFGNHPQVASLLERIDQAKTLDELVPLYAELKPLYARELDENSSYATDLTAPRSNYDLTSLGSSGLLEQYFANAKFVLQAEGMGVSSEKIQKLEQGLKEIKEEKDPAKKLGLYQQWKGDIDRTTWKYVMKGELKMAEELKKSGKRFNKWVAWIPYVDRVNLQKVFDPHIEKLNTALAEFDQGEAFIEKADLALRAGDMDLYQDLARKGNEHIARAWETYRTLSQSIERKILIDEGQDSALYTGLVLGIGIIAIAALTAGTATPFLVPEAGFLATTAVSAAVFTGTYEILNSAVYDDTFILSPDRWDSLSEVGHNLLHLGGSYIENFAMFYFMGAIFEKSFTKLLNWRMLSTAEKMAIEAGEMVKVGEKLTPIVKGEFRLLSKDVQETLLNAAKEGRGLASKGAWWLAQETWNYVGLNAWTVASSPFTGNSADIFSWKGQKFTIMFLVGLMPMNFLSGKLLQATLVPHLQTKFGKKLTRELEGFQKDEIQLQMEQVRLTKEGLLRLNMVEEAKHCDAILEWYAKEGKDVPSINPSDALGLHMIMVKKISENPQVLKKPEWAHWMERAAELDVKLGEAAIKKSDYMEKYPSAFTSTKAKQDPSGQWDVVLDPAVRNEAKKAAFFAEQSKPFYERMARMIKAHREFFGEKAAYDPIKNLKEIPYSKNRGADFIDALPKLLGADAEHPVFLQVAENGTIQVVMVTIDPEKGPVHESFFITPKKEVSPDEVAQMRRHIRKVGEKNLYVKKFSGNENDLVINISEDGQVVTKGESQIIDPEPKVASPIVDENTFVPPPSTVSTPPPPPADAYQNLRVDPMTVREAEDCLNCIEGA